jgi:hypothetical protein
MIKRRTAVTTVNGFTSFSFICKKKKTEAANTTRMITKPRTPEMGFMIFSI